MRIFFKIGLLVFAFFSCTPPESNKSVQDSEKNLVTETKGIQDFQFFWDNFRNAVVAGDSANILSFLNTPLKMRGYEDSDPEIVVYSRDSAINLFNRFLTEKNVNYKNLSTHRDFIKSVSEISEYDTTLTENEKRIENMEFEKTESGWKLIRGYLDTKSN